MAPVRRKRHLLCTITHYKKRLSSSTAFDVNVYVYSQLGMNADGMGNPIGLPNDVEVKLELL